MRMSRSILLVFAFALSACGNKGPLVLPDKPQEQQEKKNPPADTVPVPAPAAKTGDATHPR
jgi:predicted small lipoprotein YifL